MMTLASGSGLKMIEGFCFVEGSLKTIQIPSNVHFIGESALAAKSLELIEVYETNAQFTTYEHTLFETQNAIAVRYFGGGKRVVVSKHVRVINHVCFSKRNLDG
jgi:hypothetical protein